MARTLGRPSPVSVLLLALLVLGGGCGPRGAHAYTEGIEHFNQQQYDKAAKALRQAIEQNPEFAEAHQSLGVCLMELDDLDGAAAAFDKARALWEAGKAVETDDSRTLPQKQALVHRHLALVEEHRYARKIVDDPDAAVGHLRRAAELYRKTRKIDPDEPHAAQRLAKVESLLESFDK